jgi:hypothetical protein
LPLLLNASARSPSSRSSRGSAVHGGDPTLSYEKMALAADADLTLGVFTAEPEEALNLLASWAATVDEPESPETAERTQVNSRCGEGRIQSAERAEPTLVVHRL